MAADVLDRLLITLAVRLHAFAVCRIQRGWRLAFEPMEAVTIHYVLAGSGTLRTGNGDAVAFSPHTIMVVPAGLPQSLGADGAVVGEARADEHCAVLDDGLVSFTAGDGSRDILVVCGTISASYGGAFGLFDHLRGPIAEDLSARSVLRHVFELLLDEVSRPGIGTQALTEALMKQCLVLLFREHLTRMGVASPFFAALRDPRLARAVVGILERPAAPHTVDSLAATAGMSRSAFADRFLQTYGQPPIEFVQKVRLRLAAQMLSATDLPVKVIAASVGYASRSYFSRAFRTAYGVDPKTFRAVGGAQEEEAKPVEIPTREGKAGADEG